MKRMTVALVLIFAGAASADDLQIQTLAIHGAAELALQSVPSGGFIAQQQVRAENLNAVLPPTSVQAFVDSAW